MNAKPRVLVTGGAGFVGSHVCKLLAQAGYEPVAYDDLSRGHSVLVRYGPLVVGSIHDRVKLRAVLASYRPIACLHFAAYAYVAESIARPALYYRNNVLGSLTLLEALVESGILVVVFSSTCAVYGQAERVPIAENTPPRPLSPYARTKLAVEGLLTDLDRAHGMKSFTLRYFNACGADPDGEVGELHDPEPHVIPRALMAASGVLPSFEVFGTDYPTADGTAIRDYTHVMDLAAAHVSALNQLLSGSETKILNLGTGRGYSVKQVIDVVEQVTGRRVPTTLSSRRPGDPAEVVADATQAQRLLGFQPRYPDLARMVATAWNWYKAHGLPGTSAASSTMA